MSNKPLDHYFAATKHIPEAMSLEQVQKMVHLSAGMPPKPWWKLKPFIMSSVITTIVVTATLVAVNFNTNPNTTEILAAAEPLHMPTTTTNNTTAPFETTTPLAVVKPLTEEDELWLEMEAQPIFPLEVNANDEFAELLPRSVEPLAVVVPENIVFEPEVFVPDTTLKPKESYTGDTKTIVQEFDAAFFDRLKMNHFGGDITVETTATNNISVSATLKVETKKAEDQRTVLENFELVFGTESGELAVDNNWSTSCNSNKVEIDGKKIKVKSYSVDYTVKIPESMSVNLKNNHGDILIGNVAGEATFSLFSGTLKTGDIAGKVTAKVRYGKLDIGNVNEAKVTLFDTDGSIGSSTDLNLDSRYSDINLLSIEDLSINGFSGKTIIASGAKNIEGNIRYGTFELAAPATSIDLVGFELKCNLHDVQTLKLNTRYSKVNTGNIENFDLSSSFSDHIKTGNVGTLTSNARYTSFSVNQISTSLKVRNFDGSIVVGKVLPSFTSIDMDTRYTRIDLAFEEECKYTLSTSTRYTKLTLPSNQNASTDDNNSESKTFDGAINGSGSTPTATVKAVCFDGSLLLH